MTRYRLTKKNHSWRLLVAAVIIGSLLFYGLAGINRFLTKPALEKSAKFHLQNTEGLARTVLQTLVDTQSKQVHQFLLPENQGPVYVVLRRSGLKYASAWNASVDWYHGIIQAIQQALDKLEPAQAEAVDTIELCLTHSYQTIDLNRDHRHITDIHRGVRGLELTYNNDKTVWSPTQMLATNVSFDNALKRFSRDNGLTDSALNSADVKKRIFEAYQFIIDLSKEPVIIPIFRGNNIVTIDQVTQQNVRSLAQSLQNWLVSNVHPNGRVTYKYWPSRGTEASSNNMIRQFMASICLGRLAALQNDSALIEVNRKNLNYNFDNFYHREANLGLIEYQGEVKLGAVALAALAVIESPLRGRYASYEQSLLTLVDHLWNPDGSFTTFYSPKGRNDNQNFYPGEAILLWATLYKQTKSPELLNKFMTSFRYYREWHLKNKNRNPAFVPWHTQADYIVYKETKSNELSSFIFNMNDWLLSMQQWKDTPYDDIKGRFYDPDNPGYGPPHASSTGVYLEGLIDAFCLAKQLGDQKRLDTYRLAIVRGLRNVMQLQFNDDIDMFYISNRKPVKGGLRTDVYDNQIRVDNIQHNLDAITKILQHFDPNDYLSAQTPFP